MMFHGITVGFVEPLNTRYSVAELPKVDESPSVTQLRPVML